MKALSKSIVSIALFAAGGSCAGQGGEGDVGEPGGSGEVIGPDGLPVPIDGASPDDPGPGDGATPAVAATDPGRVTLHRLNRAEYNNTVRDLLGTALRPADEFPIDDRGIGFDNIADVLAVSPLHLSTYNTAAETLVAEALANEAQRSRVVACDLLAEGDACAASSLEAFMRRAWRRPVTPDEVARFMAPVAVAVTQGDTHEVGLSLALRAVLVSPNFIFRVEVDPDPSSLEPHPLGAYELASRLSYFLWSSMPDEELFGMAESEALLDPAELASQATRMLADPKASALVDNFAGQWLALRAIANVAPDTALYPDFDEELRAAMRAESEMLFREIVSNGLPLDQLLTADFTFVNDRLARHYGLSLPGSDELIRVTLDGDERLGFLGHASFLTVQSHPNRTSPVLRGKWVLNELLCTAIPPPPPDVDIATINEPVAGVTQRDRLEQHRSQAACATCHGLMDPIGLGLENYDAIGAYRTLDNDLPIDASGQLPTGETFIGGVELARLIASRPEFARCIAERLYTYALGRAPNPAPGHLDTPTLANLANQLSTNGYDFPALITALVQSSTFLNRRGDAGGTAP